MTILVTRPSPYGEKLVSKLLSFGKKAFHLPLIYFSTGKTLYLLEKQLNLLSKGDLLLITSQQAINYAHRRLIDIRKSWPIGLIYCAIGRSTSKKMHNLSGILAKYPIDEETSECLLQSPELMHINGKRVLILRGNNGRTILDDVLRQRGAMVLSCECYSRNLLKYDGLEQCLNLLRLNIEILVITSGVVLEQLYYLIPKFYRIGWLIRCKLVVVSMRLASVARNLGWTDIIIAKSADNNSLIQVLVEEL
ncbi:uroporphyrinogen-III synthase [Candidatus Blochmannia ocreatus (nom. nud.)]|uniref:Uroporphyrinogen-III synthase n=1 Tax=Candidatus Blochmannia ocreatus (nom. nud.) TaxID=251538 RepID=A0ABY4SSU2_9ENTR|nr:uroporphyrinogen-III synthase [Candidatus Blochmannia ocreatus]URJ25056.1 uroporphyrinogen-III synthase [Candidatus Blochmannia ocreatus]